MPDATTVPRPGPLGDDLPPKGKDRFVRLRASLLRDLHRAIADAAGREAAEDAFFRLGRSWGSEDAARLERRLPRAGARARFEAGLSTLEPAGLARATLDEFHLERRRGICRIRGLVFDPIEFGFLERAGQPATGGVCGLTAGYLTGLASGLTRLDLLCTPFTCRGVCSEPGCPAPGCPFEIRPAHAFAPGEAPPPAGSARFFLHGLGVGLGSADLSLADLVEESDDAILFVDRDRRVRYWNRGAERMFGWRREEVQGRFYDFLLPDDLREGGELATLEDSERRDGVVRNWLTRRRTKDGRELRVSLTRTVLRNSAGEIVGTSAVFRDVTENWRAEQELARARHLAAIGEMAAKIAHEIKNPLAGIYGAIQLLARGVPREDPRAEVLSNVSAEVRRVDETMQDLLRFSRPAPPRPAPVDLVALLRSLLDMLSTNPTLKDVAVRIESDDAVVAPADTRLVSQVFENLLLNAAEAMGGKGEVAVTFRRAGGDIVAEVADRGRGIPDGHFETLFEPFFTTKARGTGLGLSIARRNVELHGGSLVARNRPGGGALFVVTIPAGDLPRA